MGISDKDYADALVYEKQKQAQQQQMEKQMAGTVSAGGVNHTVTSTNALGAWGTSPLTTTTGTGSWENRSPLGIKTLNEQDLQHEAMKAPLSALIDMWTMRWSGEWVSETEFQEDDFWRLALIRLTGANKLEKHHLANQYAAVYRIIE